MPHTGFHYILQPPFCRWKDTEVGQLSGSGRVGVPKKVVRYKIGRLLRQKPTALKRGEFRAMQFGQVAHNCGGGGGGGEEIPQMRKEGVRKDHF